MSWRDRIVVPADWPRHTGILINAVDEDDALFLVDFDKANFDDFRVAGLNGAANVLGFDRHFAMAAIDQYAKRDALGAAEVEEPVHGGADCATGIEDVVHQDEVHAVNAEGDVRRLQDGLGSNFGEIVEVKSDVQRADGNVDAVNAAHGSGDALGH